jgi:hypothetical protein
MENRIIFAGPTLRDIPSESLKKLNSLYLLREPVRRGDIDALVQTGMPGEIVLVDGMFFDVPAVGHKEIMNALRAGWKVQGLSSMGAIRAAEMQRYGMIGFGRVFEMFAADPAFRDDEVTLLHHAAPSYEPISEPLVHLRLMLNHMLEESIISDRQHTDVLTTLENIWFGYRTLENLSKLLVQYGVDYGSDASDLRVSIKNFRIKSEDLTKFVNLIN